MALNTNSLVFLIVSLIMICRKITDFDSYTIQSSIYSAYYRVPHDIEIKDNEPELI